VPAYLHPGVYLEEIGSGARPVDAVATSVTVFVGEATRGPIATPTLVHSQDDYEAVFGPLASATDTMGLAAGAFYRNGGKDAYFVRVADPTAANTKAAALDLDGETATKVVTVLASSEGAWGNAIFVRVRKPAATDTSFALDVGHTVKRSGADVFVVDETFAGLNLTDGDARFAPSVVNTSSRLVRLRLNSATGGLPKAFPTGNVDATALTGGAAGAASQADYRAAFAKLEKVRDISIIVLPGKAMAANGTGNTAVAEALSHCNKVGNRMVIIDPPPGTELTTGAAVNALNLPTSNYSALYYPWLTIPNPFYNPDSNPTAPRTLTMAPSAFAAALWSRTDGRRGVWKGPAGVEAQLIGVAGLEFEVGDGDQDQLNPLGVNCVRKLPSFGAVIWGARTLATNAEPPWRYIPVRRTAIMIEQSIYNGIQWAVFEPNDHRLWSSLRVNVGAFMDNLFRAGAFQGEKASDAYFVRCARGDTMTQDDIDRGQVIVVVGFAPLKPAEFVIVRIQQKTQQ
jgi:phage tail sheath protein FI